MHGSNDLEGALLFVLCSSISRCSVAASISVCPQVSFHTDVQFYVRTPKGKCMGPKLLNALLCMHALVKSMKHMNCEALLY